MRTKQSTKRLVAALVLMVLCFLVSLQAGTINRLSAQLWDIIAQRDPTYAAVEEVVDGDTIRVNLGQTIETIRLVGVDTPETSHPSKPVQCFGQAATRFLESMLNGQSVRLIADPESTNRDRYNRLLRHVYLRDGTHVNAEIIKEGFGFAYVAFPLSTLNEFRVYEQEARLTGKGLWSGCNPYFNGEYYEV